MRERECGKARVRSGRALVEFGDGAPHLFCGFNTPVRQAEKGKSAARRVAMGAVIPPPGVQGSGFRVQG